MGNRNQYVEDEDEIFVAIDQMGANEITVTMLSKVQRYVSSDNFTTYQWQTLTKLRNVKLLELD